MFLPFRLFFKMLLKILEWCWVCDMNRTIWVFNVIVTNSKGCFPFTSLISQTVFSSLLKLCSAYPISNHMFGWLLSNCQHLCHMVGGQISVCHHIIYSHYLVGSIEQVLGNPAVIHSPHTTGLCSAELWWISLENYCSGRTPRPGYNLALVFDIQQST